MKFIQTPVKGMQDFLPADMALRQFVLGIIRDTYGKYGFTEIGTPAMEHIENLTGKNGGENEKLIFKVLKRGRELDKGFKSVQEMQEKAGEDAPFSSELAGTQLSDSALRYDLTVPLCRYYSCHKNELPSPFKALQIGSVFRADRPQKGRFRQFTQCDIDIIGDNSVMAEIELIAATCSALCAIFDKAGIRGFTVHVNDRRILKAMASSAGFAPEQFDEVFITLDKMDKIGPEGVKEELLNAGFDAAAVEKYTGFYAKFREGAAGEVDGRDDGQGQAAPVADVNSFISATCADTLEEGVASDLDNIMESVRAMVDPDVSLMFDPTLVRGMSYYTGTIFEVSIDNYSFSIAGGGRYDKMVGRFCGQDAPACGFSIGFERIVTILRDLGFTAPETGAKKAYLVDVKSAKARLSEVFGLAAKERAEGAMVVVQPLRKNAKFQVEMLEKSGYADIRKVYGDTEL